MDFGQGSANPMLIFFLILRICSAIDTISPTQSITDGNTIVSAGGKFELGFFNPGNSTNRYVGIWYSNVPGPTAVWVANRENPLMNSSGILAISSGNLVLLDGSRRVLWSTDLSNGATNTSATLLDSGNLVLRELNYENSGIVLWQSFDYPTDTLLPEMKLGLNLRTGMNWSLTSWKSPNDPARGEYSYVLDPRGSPQFFLIQGSRRYGRSGPWNGVRLSGVPQMDSNYVINYNYVDNREEIYYSYDLHNDSILSRLILDVSGRLERRTWIDGSNIWNLFWSAPADQCDPYATCGANGICTANEASWCACLRGFTPRSPRDWYLREESGGCNRSMPLECGQGDGFMKVERAKLPDTSGSQVISNSSLVDCQRECLNNCSCTAYASASIIGGGDGCLIWYGDLIDLRVFSNSGQDVYIRLAASEQDASDSEDSNKRNLVIALVTVSLGVLLLASFGYFLWGKKKRGRAEMASCSSRLRNLGTNRSGIKDTSETTEFHESSHRSELPVFDLDTIASVTDNFSSENKLGEGGFGPVYKGVLAKGEEIAVKRLSRNSGQGREEFKNEVILIARLQHRNLVKLLGCCIQGDERMLIYEYMPNRSLDSFIFDRTRRVSLNWRKRFSIIVGIARGVLYLHQDSRLRIIHRDLKASNILLDAEMNPKISDFGMARIFGGNQTQANTNRVVGTHGYMAPEYAMDGLFSVKSDVFSFGVLLLEIVCGRKNSGYYHDDPTLNLLGHVWNMWRDGRGLEILDSSMTGSSSASEVLRCIHVGLLCVQESSADRPTMSSVLSLLTNETAVPPPKQPAFSMKSTIDERNSSSSGTGSHSINEVTVTAIHGR